MREALPAYPRALISDLSSSQARGLGDFYGVMRDPVSASFRNLDTSEVFLSLPTEGWERKSYLCRRSLQPSIYHWSIYSTQSSLPWAL